MKFLNNFKTLSFVIVAILFISCGGVSEKEDKKGAKKIEIGEVTATYSVEALTNHEYTFSGGDLAKKSDNPDLTLQRGKTYQFKVETFGHPFLIKTKQVIGPKELYEKGVINNGTEYGTISFVVPKDAPDTLFYVCKFHKMMTGKLIITD